MHVRGRVFSFVSGCLLAAGASPVAAQQAKWDSHLDLEARPGNERSLGEADLFLPLVQDPRTLLFGDLRGKLDNQSSNEGNLGLGVRRMLDSGWNLGGYGYFDRRKTANDNYYSQVAFGGEALGRDWDLRANVYVPVGERVRELGTASTASVSGNTVVVSSVTSQERALKGFDGEIGWRAPLFDVDAPTQTRLYAGGYQFKDDVVKLSGPRVRAELTMAELNGLWTGAEVMLSAEVQHDDLRGSQRFVGVRVRVPLGGEKEPPHLNWQERRMTAPVVRDVDIVAPVVAGAPIVDTAITTSDGRAIAGISSDATTGAALPGAVAAAGANSVVLLGGTFSTTGAIALQNGQTLMGAGTLTVNTSTGRTVTVTTTQATINALVPGAGTTPALLAANNSTITGLVITNASNTTTQNPVGIFANGVSGATISNNTISISQNVPAGGTAQAVLVSSSGNVTVSNNMLTASSVTLAIGVNLVNSSATVTGNTLSATGPSPGNSRAVSLSGATVLPGSNGNVLTAGICSIAAAGPGTTVNFTNAAPCGP